MTDVVPDAKCTEISNAVKNIAMRVTPAILKEMLNDLDKSELISLVFLMVDRNTDFYKVLEEVKEDPRIAFEKLPSMNAWAEKLIESLMILGNKYVIRRMGFDNNEIQFLENLFVTRQHNVSPYLNKAIKSLYFLCANLDNNEAKRLINEVNKNLGKSSHVNPNDIYLELFILEWLQEEYISVNPDEYNLSNLLKCVKNIGCLFDLSFNFDYWEISDMVLSRDKEDSQICSQTPDINCSSQYHQNINCNTSNIDADIMWSSPDHLKLFIIINQMDFTDTQKFKSRRKGSMEDEINLEKTFKSCNFQIEKYRNLKKQSMMKLLESLNSKLYSKYGAIFICVLSHGFKGEVVCADDNCISIDAIKEKFCCQKLQNVFKFLILQSCQGEKIGLVERQYGKLVKDGPSNFTNPRYRMHFCLFHATVQDFAAIRDQMRGSWFIQDLCKQIHEADKQIEISDLIKKVKLAVTNRRGRLTDHDLEDAVQVPEVSGDTTMYPYVLIKVM